MKNRYKIIILILVLIFLVQMKIKTTKTKSVIGDNKITVIVDAGHGGSDPGKVAGKIKEKDINLEIAKKVQTELLNLGYEVIMTREDDTMPKNKQDEMYKRKTTANSSGGDIFISIHQNSSSNYGAKGFQIYYFHKSEESERLAYDIFNKIKENVNPSTKFEPIENTDYYVLRQTKMPAVLVECGFLTNEGDRWLMQTEEFQNKMAFSIAQGVQTYFKDMEE